MSVSTIIKNASETELPAPISISDSDEIIWSSSTGRAASCKMVGRALAEKKTFSIQWGVLTQAQLTLIKNSVPLGFFDFYIFGTKYTVYRGSIAYDRLGDVGDGTTYYKSASVELIER